MIKLYIPGGKNPIKVGRGRTLGQAEQLTRFFIIFPLKCAVFAIGSKRAIDKISHTLIGALEADPFIFSW
jgi:hypothetical protein